MSGNTGMFNGQPLIRVQDLGKSFVSIDVLKGITVDIHKGDVVFVVGPSGSGKSTFLRCLNLLEEPTGGSIIFNGVDITKKKIKNAEGKTVKVDIDQHRQKMGMVFQHFNLFPHMTIMDNMTLAPIQVKHMDRGEAEKKALALLDRVGLQDRARAYPIQLSGGQKQRVALARTMVMKPRILLLDEPLSALDGVIKESIKEKIKEIAREFKLTTIIVTHDPEEALTLSDRVLIIDQGSISQYAKPDEIVHQPRNDFVRKFILRQLEIKRGNIYALFGDRPQLAGEAV